MNTMKITRTTEPLLKRLASQYPVVTLTGPRQSGKTTLCQMAFPERPYVSLETPDDRRKATEDPRAFLEEYHGGIIDEFQQVPELPSYIQTIVDRTGDPGQYILTGSRQFEVMEQVSQSLAGRTALLKLLPFSMREAAELSSGWDTWHAVWHGFYPRLFDRGLSPTEAYSYYFQTYMERDVRAILNVHDLGNFEKFVRILAGRTGQILNLSGIANDCGVRYNTISSWISVLEASYLVYRLQPHFNNLGKRLVKSPKIYFLDPGLCAYLIGITEPGQLQSHPLRGSLFETLVVGELLKQRFHAGRESNLYYWRDGTGHEIDVLMDFGTRLFPLEIKSGTTVNNDFYKDLEFYRRLNPAADKCGLVYGGDNRDVRNGIWTAGITHLTELDGLDYRIDIFGQHDS